MPTQKAAEVVFLSKGSIYNRDKLKKVNKSKWGLKYLHPLKMQICFAQLS